KEVVYEALSSRDEEERAQITSAMSFEDNQVGALMDFELVSIRADVTCEVVLRYLRRFERLPDHTDKIFVVDNYDVLQGVLPIRSLLVADPDSLVSSVMADDVVTFRPEDDAEEAAAAFERYDLVTAPVVDNNLKLIGRITVDEMVDVIREESENDMLNMAGLREEEDLFAPVIDSVRNRWIWLAVNLCTAFIASRVIGMFENSIEKIVALATLMPIVAGIGGNSGNQTITMIVRAMTSGQISNSQAWRLLRKEEGVALVNGLIWGSVMGLVSYFLYHSVGIGLVMVAAMTLNLILAATVGVLIPVCMQKSGRDPALGSSVLITAVTDSGGFFIFLGLATLFLL
ncbi:MAG: magnesium transporter, partial [Snodgrassella alvi]|nr:magnesium transporter [Snodgrassella alvi]